MLLFLVNCIYWMRNQRALCRSDCLFTFSFQFPVISGHLVVDYWFIVVCHGTSILVLSILCFQGTFLSFLSILLSNCFINAVQQQNIIHVSMVYFGFKNVPYSFWSSPYRCVSILQDLEGYFLSYIDFFINEFNPFLNR